MERQQKGGGIRDIHYIDAGNGLCAIVVKEGSGTDIFYTYKDYLGNVLTVTNSAGVLVAEQSFDAWGRKRNVNDGTYTNVSATPDWLYRAYTGHEHIAELGLINMNGRMYDPVQGRMMSPDALINDQYATQSFNMYSYVLNNPLRFVDPTGYTYSSWDEVFDDIEKAWDSPFGGTWNAATGVFTEFASDAEALIAGWIAGGFGSGEADLGTDSAPSWDQVQSQYFQFGGTDQSVASLSEPIVVYGKIVNDQWQTSSVSYPDSYGRFYPCEKSFNFVKVGSGQQTWQVAVVTDYFMTLRMNDQRQRGEFKLNIGSVEIQIPFKAYNGNLIHAKNATQMASIAGGLAEFAVMNVMSTCIRANPTVTPETMNYSHYKIMFKEAYREALDDLLRRNYYDGENVSPSRVVYTNFLLKDTRQYRKYDYSQDGCQ